MGTTPSHLQQPPPLIQISGPRSKIFIPAGTGFTFHPPDHKGRPRYHPDSPIYGGGGGRPPLSPQRRFQSPGSGGEDLDLDLDLDLEEEYGNGGGGRRAQDRDFRPIFTPVRDGAGNRRGVMDGMSPMRGARGRGFPRDYAGFGRAGARPRFGSFDDGRPMTAPELGMYDSYPGLRGGGGGGGMGHEMGGGMMGGPGMGMGMGMGVRPPYPYQSPYAAQGGQMPMAGMQSQTGFTPGPRYARPAPNPGMGMAGMPTGVQGPTASYPPPNIRRDSGPQDAEPAVRFASKRPTSKPAERPQSPAPWETGNPFLDVCVCTTECTCRKGCRVWYRKQKRNGDTSEGRYRYILESQLGKNCDDHTNCGNGGSGKNAGRPGSKDPCAAARMEAREGIQRLDENMAEIMGKLDEMDLKQRGPMRSPPGMMGGGRGFPGAMPGGVDPMMGSMPPSRMGPPRMPPPQMGPMPRMGGMYPGFDEDMDDFGADMIDPMAMEGRRLGRGGMGDWRAMPPELMGPRPNRGFPRGMPGAGPPGRRPPMGRGGPNPAMGMGGRRRRPEFPGMPIDVRGGMGPHGREIEELDDSDDWEDTEIDGSVEERGSRAGRQRGSPVGRPSRTRDRRSNMSRNKGSRGRHAHVDTIEEDEDDD